jgi:hypothetical protein
MHTLKGVNPVDIVNAIIKLLILIPIIIISIIYIIKENIIIT